MSVSDISRLNKRIDDLERRIIDMREETEAMIKLEIGGAIANLETRLEERIAVQLDGKLGTLEGRTDETFARMDEKFARIDKKFDRVDEKFDGLYALPDQRLPC